MQKVNTKYLRSGKYTPHNSCFIYYENSSKNFWADDDGDKITVCYGPLSGGCDYWDLSREHKKALLDIVDRYGMDTRKLLAYTREHDMNKKDEEPNGLGVKLSLVGKDGNAFSILGLFRRAARRQGFTDEQIDPIIKEAKSGDYEHLLYTIQSNIN